jgi:glutamate formiminotransferase / formiminotetrahydrofolate cyclodeaminase
LNPLVECVPNFSEGRNRAVLDEISRAIEGIDGARLLDVDPGAATNRTVFTFVGTPAAALEAAFRAIQTAAERIDMRTHHGEHARLGATDVCPFVPLAGATMEDCVTLARQLGERVASTLGIPVYLYEEAASRPERRNLATIRTGEYEGLDAKLRDPAWLPDFGAAQFNPKSGATVIGAREFLVAYNINLNTRDKKLAHDIALDLREAGRAQRGPDGAILRGADGKPRMQPGMFRSVKAVGWYIDEYERAQISINFTNTKISAVHAVFDAACSEAEKRGLRVTGSELVGLIPRDVLLAAGRHYLQKQGRTAAVPERELVHIAVRSLGLDELRPFVPEEKIIEYRVREAHDFRLRKQSLIDFADQLSTDSPAPGGGSAAALCGSLAAALSAMVASLVPRTSGEARQAELETLGTAAQALKDELLGAVDTDAAAFDAVLAARRLPKDTEASRAARDTAIRHATRGATEMPLQVLRGASRAAVLAREAARLGLSATRSDAGVAALCAVAAAEGAYYNVLINLRGMTEAVDAEYTSAMRLQADRLLADALEVGGAVRDAVRQELTGPV